MRFARKKGLKMCIWIIVFRLGSLGFLLGLFGLGCFCLLGGCLLGLHELGDYLLVLLPCLSLGLEGPQLVPLEDLLPSESLLGDESLDLGGLVEGLVSLLDFSLDHVLPHVVYSSSLLVVPESEDFSDGLGPLGSESSWSLSVGQTLNFVLTLLCNS